MAGMEEASTVYRFRDAKEAALRFEEARAVGKRATLARAREGWIVEISETVEE